MQKKIGTKNLEIFPGAAKEEWDGLEVHPCKIFKDGGEEFVEQCEPDEKPDMWSVYVHLKEGGVQCIADMPTEELANQMEALIYSLIETYEPAYTRAQFMDTMMHVYGKTRAEWKMVRVGDDWDGSFFNKEDLYDMAKPGVEYDITPYYGGLYTSKKRHDPYGKELRITIK